MAQVVTSNSKQNSPQPETELVIKLTEKGGYVSSVTQRNGYRGELLKEIKDHPDKYSEKVFKVELNKIITVRLYSPDNTHKTLKDIQKLIVRKAAGQNEPPDRLYIVRVKIGNNWVEISKLKPAAPASQPVKKAEPLPSIDDITMPAAEIADAEGKPKETIDDWIQSDGPKGIPTDLTLSPEQIAEMGGVIIAPSPAPNSSSQAAVKPELPEISLEDELLPQQNEDQISFEAEIIPEETTTQSKTEIKSNKKEPEPEPVKDEEGGIEFDWEEEPIASVGSHEVQKIEIKPKVDVVDVAEETAKNTEASESAVDEAKKKNKVQESSKTQDREGLQDENPANVKAGEDIKLEAPRPLNKVKALRTKEIVISDEGGLPASKESLQSLIKSVGGNRHVDSKVQPKVVDEIIPTTPEENSAMTVLFTEESQRIIIEDHKTRLEHHKKPGIKLKPFPQAIVKDAAALKKPLCTRIQEILMPNNTANLNLQTPLYKLLFRIYDGKTNLGIEGEKKLLKTVQPFVEKLLTLRGQRNDQKVTGTVERAVKGPKQLIEDLKIGANAVKAGSFNKTELALAEMTKGFQNLSREEKQEIAAVFNELQQVARNSNVYQKMSSDDRKKWEKSVGKYGDKIKGPGGK